MPNRFGLKDLVIVVLVVGVGVALAISMWQRDRQWEQMQRVEAKLDDAQARIDALATAAPKATTAAPASPPKEADRAAAWARPNVPISWQPPFEFTTNPAAQPGFRDGGDFTEIWDGRCARVTPYLENDVYSRRAIDLVCDPLATFDPKTLELRGVLADAWQYAPDGTWLRVHLRPEATFSDGTPVTAEDVRYTFKDYIGNPLVQAAGTRSTLDMLEDVKVIDDRTVELVFNKVLFTNLAAPLNSVILPKHFYSRFEPEQINQSTSLLMGSGQFRLESLDPTKQWTPGDDLVLVRNERYWNRPTRTPLARVRFKTIQDERARLVAYRNGEGDLITPTAPQFVTVQQEPDWDKANRSLNWVNMRTSYTFIAWQCGKRKGERETPFADKRVRQAMTLLIDRAQMIADIWSNVGVVAKGPFSPASPASDPALQAWPHDLERAKKLLAEAGWKDRDGDGVLENEKGEPFEFELTMPSMGDIMDRIASFMKNACLKAGIRCNVRMVDWSVFADVRNARDFDALVLGWQAAAPESDVRQMFHSSSIKGGGDNFMQWSSADADAAMDLAATTLDGAERMKVWHRLERLLHEEQPYTFVRAVPWIRFLKKDVGNVNTYRSGLEMWEFFRPAAAASPAT